jgi:very-short-patch-repair endonuclease
MAEQFQIDPDIGGESGTLWTDGLIVALAERQHGIVARRQLLDAGIGRRAIDHRVDLGRLHVVHRGVYALGHRVLLTRARWMAAVLASGPGAVLSHRPAAVLAGLRRPPAPLEVTVRHHGSGRRGIRTSYARLPDDEVTVIDGIPVTTVPRTLLDLASVLPPHQLERALNEAEIQGRSDSLSLPELIVRYPRRKGVAAIRDALGAGPVPTRDELEARFRAFIRARRLPTPRFNFNVQGYECDCVWPDRGLIVELDSRAFHDTSAAFERDRERDRILTAAGWRVIRVTWRQLHQARERVAADLRRLLVG